MAPLPALKALHTFARRQNFSVSVPNPLQDKSFVTIIVGLVVGAVVFLMILTLILCLYRENSPLKRCCGRRFKRATETPPPPHLKEYESGLSIANTPEPEGSRTNLVGGAQGMGMSQVPGQNSASANVGVGLKKKRRRTRTSLDLSILPISKLLPYIPALPSSPTALLSLPPLPSPPYFLSPLGKNHRDSIASGATMMTDTTTSSSSTESGDYAPNTRKMLLSADSFTQYSWLLDIIHDHTAGLFKHTRLSQLGPYRLARVMEVNGLLGVGLAQGEGDSGYCSSPAKSADTNMS